MKRHRYKVPFQPLFELAEAQEGIFTAKQAVSLGIPTANHHYHVKNGSWIREHRGIYRLAQFPRSTYEQYAIWSLWSCNREGEIQGVYSYETALAFYDLSDLNPSKMHMIVPEDFRKSQKTPKILKLYYGDIPPSDYKMVRGFKIAKPLRAIQDLFIANTVQVDFLKQALREGISQGLILRSELADPKLPEAFRLALLEWIVEKKDLK